MIALGLCCLMAARPLFSSATQSPVVALGYLGVSAMLFGFARYAHVSPAEPSALHDHGEMTVQPAE